MLKAGIVGAGAVANGTHAPAYTEIPNVSLEAIAELDDERREQFGRKFNVKQRYADAEQMFESADLDLVSICTPPHMHEELVIAAADAGLAILCEKPIATTVEAAENMLDAIEEAQVDAAGGYSLPYYKPFERAKKQIENNIIGSIRRIDVSYYTLNEAVKSWRMDPTKAGGGVLMDLGPHVLSGFLQLRRDEITIDSAEVHRFAAHNVESDVTLEGHLGEIPFTIKTGYRTKGGPTRIHFFGTDGQVQMTRSEVILDAHKFNLQYAQSGLPKISFALAERTVGPDPVPALEWFSQYDGDDSFKRVQSFVETVAESEPNRVPFADSVEILSAIKTAYMELGIDTPITQQ
ncbi:Gfo/Idh/MocA family protein [Halorientalis marina]|uniref:Gfo/Idh/MocA family protein n=1 Tax=Halorientalis marina TaxID=2931976 RepID=UPI001FF33E14|nr:Gfo/Idh/MocA family oxidoreductase [Halorientalis marina]